MVELRDLEYGVHCDRCLRLFGKEQLVFVSTCEDEGMLLCVSCLLYFLGEFLGREANNDLDELCDCEGGELRYG